jgi:nicotinamidase-related amidase
LSQALIVIDVQNDYFAGGAFPLWNADAALDATEKAIHAASAKGMLVVLVQHVAKAPPGAAPFFNADTEGVKIHPRVLAAAPQAPVVVKHYPDAFEDTTLHELLQARSVDELLVCGMMTQHCVTYTSLSPRAGDYRKLTVLRDAVTTLSETVNKLALGGLGRRVGMATVDEALA